MRTPGHDFELAAGWLLHEGIAGRADLRTVAYCTDEELTPQQEFNVVTATLDAPPARDVGHRHVAASTGSSACGVCGKDSVEDALATPRAARWTGPLPHADVVRTLPDRLREAQPVFGQTGGVHAAGLATAEGELLVVREDVGRHNAVDKVTGARVLAGDPVAEAVLVVSGRAGFELVQKAVAAGVGQPGGRRGAHVAGRRPGTGGRARPVGVHPRRPHRPLRRERVCVCGACAPRWKAY